MVKTRKIESNKCVNFDLNTNAINGLIANGAVKFKKYTAAYGNIRRFLEKGGFAHDQGSGYVSKAPMGVTDARRIFQNLGQKNPWLASCMPKCRLTSFDDGAMTYTDLLPDIQSGAKLAEKGNGLTPSPAGYGAARSEQSAKQANALWTTLKSSSLNFLAPAPTPLPTSKPTINPIIKTPSKAPRDKGSNGYSL